MNEQEVNEYIDELLGLDRKQLIERITRLEHKPTEATEESNAVDPFKLMEAGSISSRWVDEKEWESMNEFERIGLKVKDIEAYRNARKGNFNTGGK